VHGILKEGVRKALKKGRLTAWHDDTPLPPEFWKHDATIIVDLVIGPFPPELWCENESEVRQLDLTSGGYLVSRTEVLNIWPEPGADPEREHDKLTLLWDFADEMSAANRKQSGWNWLRIMDAFWRGDLGHLVLRYSDSVYGGRGQSLSREQLAGL